MKRIIHGNLYITSQKLRILSKSSIRNSKKRKSKQRSRKKLRTLIGRRKDHLMSQREVFLNKVKLIEASEQRIALGRYKKKGKQSTRCKDRMKVINSLMKAKLVKKNLQSTQVLEIVRGSITLKPFLLINRFKKISASSNNICRLIM